jgi:hypothetical protein
MSYGFDKLQLGHFLVKSGQVDHLCTLFAQLQTAPWLTDIRSQRFPFADSKLRHSAPTRKIIPFGAPLWPLASPLASRSVFRFLRRLWAHDLIRLKSRLYGEIDLPEDQVLFILLCAAAPRGLRRWAGRWRSTMRDGDVRGCRDGAARHRMSRMSWKVEADPRGDVQTV